MTSYSTGITITTEKDCTYSETSIIFLFLTLTQTWPDTLT